MRLVNITDFILLGRYIVIEVPIVPNRQRGEGRAHCYRENALEIHLLQETSIGLASREGVRIIDRGSLIGYHYGVILFEVKLSGL